MSHSRSERTLLWLVAIGFFMETLDSTIVNTALPVMAKDLGESPLSMQSVVIAYALTLAVLIPASGWLTDRFGTKKTFLAAIVIFTIGSLLCALAPTLPLLVGARVIQGAGGSMLLPVGRLAVLRNFPGEKYLEALSFVAMPALIGPLIGPTLGGWISETFSWHWIFLINIPIGIIGCYTTYRSMPQDDFIIKRKFDVLGFLQLTSFMLCISFAFEGMAGKTFSPGLTLFLLVFGLASIVTYVFHAKKSHDPLLSLKLFATRTFSIGILGNLFARIGASCMPFLLPLFLQLCLNYSPIDAGMAMLPLAISAIIAKRIVSPLIGLLGFKRFLLTNTILVGLSIASFGFMSGEENTYLRISHFVILGIFNSMQFTAMNTLTMKDLEKRLSSHGNTMFSMVQMMSMSFSVAAAGLLLTNFMETNEKLDSFHMTFFSMGALTCTSAWIFSQLSKKEKIVSP